MASSKYASVIFSAIVMFCIITSTYAAVYTQPAAKHPDYPGRCYDKLTKRPMLPNKEYRPKGICATMTCNIDTFTIDVETCPFIDMPGCEELQSDAKRAYPKCCPQFLCTDERTGKTFIVDLASA